MEKENDGRKGDGDDAKAKSKRPGRERREENNFIAEDKNSSNNVTNNNEEASEKVEGKVRRKRATEEIKKVEDNGGGWMSSPGKDSGKGDHIDDEDEILQSNSNAANKDKHFQDNDDIMVIPDLDDDGADADQRVSHAPRNVNRLIPTLTDLEDEVKSALASTEGKLCLGILLSTLVPPAQVKEEDTNWTFESLLRDVTDELTSTHKTVISVSTNPGFQSPIKEKVPSSKSKSHGVKKKGN
jgi:hypothetical protein